MTPREIAKSYLDRGWVTVPVEHRSKKAVIKEWPKRTMKTALATHDRWIRLGQFPRGRRVGGTIRWIWSDIERLFGVDSLEVARDRGAE